MPFELFIAGRFTRSDCPSSLEGRPAIAIMAWATSEALFVAPPDYQMENAFLSGSHLHVPVATMSTVVYSAMAIAAAIGLMWRMLPAASQEALHPFRACRPDRRWRARVQLVGSDAVMELADRKGHDAADSVTVACVRSACSRRRFDSYTWRQLEEGNERHRA